jgi:hypothetical protein
MCGAEPDPETARRVPLRQCSWGASVAAALTSKPIKLLSSASSANSGDRAGLVAGPNRLRGSRRVSPGRGLAGPPRHLSTISARRQDVVVGM